MVQRFFEKKTVSGVIATRKAGEKSRVNEELTQELHKPVIQKLKKKNLCEI